MTPEQRRTATIAAKEGKEYDTRSAADSAARWEMRSIHGDSYKPKSGVDFIIRRVPYSLKWRFELRSRPRPTMTPEQRQAVTIVAKMGGSNPFFVGTEQYNVWEASK